LRDVTVRNTHWDDVVESWPDSGSRAFLRSYNDAINRTLIEGWLPAHCDRLLKTDLFDEAVGVGLVPTLRSRAGTVVGVDASAAAVAASHRRYPELQVEVGDVRALPFESGSFDAVVSNSTLDHFATPADLDQAIAELGRVLASGGILVITLDNGANPLVALRNALPSWLLRGSRLVHFYVGATYGARGLRQALERTGFAVLESAAIMHFPRVVARGAAALSGASRDGALMRTVLRFESLARSPTRYVTGQFVAARAVKP
jgi:SAM-dependent methyltransferase